MKKNNANKALHKKVNHYFKVTEMRRLSPFEFPEFKKQIVIVSRNYKLLVALSKLAEEENVQLRHARPGTPDVLVFSGAVKIIDRPYLGKEAWETFCDYLKQVNEETEFLQCNDSEEIIFEEPIYDDTPLIIIDTNPAITRQNFIELQEAKGSVFYIDQKSLELIVHLTRKLIRISNVNGACMIKAVEGPEGVRIDE